MKLLEWCSQYRLRAEVSKSNGFSILTIKDCGDKFFVVKSRNPLFDASLALDLEQEEIDCFHKAKCTHYLFQFGGAWYCSKPGELLQEQANGYYAREAGDVLQQEHLGVNDFIPFKYWGKANQSPDLQTTFGCLGIHGGYELLNGSRMYGDWCKKASFLNMEFLGLAEKNTLAGTLAFQQACKNAGIKIRFSRKRYCPPIFTRTRINQIRFI